MKYLPIFAILGILIGGLILVLSPQPGQTKGESTVASTPIVTNNSNQIEETPDMSKQPAATTNPKKFAKAEQVIKKGKKYTATMKTEAGDITIELAADKTPNTVNNFVFLSQKGFYDGVIFHRTIPGFMIQGGDPTGTGMGDPGYKFDDESFTGEYKRGTIAMANSGKNTNGSQFFIMHADYALPPNYVIFGAVTSGLEAVDKIATAKTKAGGEGSSPEKPVKILSVTINEQ
jgi:cyclophilin family peptidyl-prolyl cis-trans isomerase